MMFNQLDAAIDILKTVNNLEEEIDCYYLLFEALAIDKFEFFQAYLKSGMNIKILLENILDDYENINTLYNRRLQSYKVKLFYFLLIILFFYLIVYYRQKQPSRKNHLFYIYERLKIKI